MRTFRRHLSALVFAGAIAAVMTVTPAQAQDDPLAEACERLGNVITRLEQVIADHPQISFLQDLLAIAQDAYAEFCS